MSIKFKFRSSVNFDTLEIDGDKPYISVGELRSKILCRKKLNNVPRKDFDLVFSDALTGREYNEDGFEIPSGSTVIVKRVPVEPVPSPMLSHQRLEKNEFSDGVPRGLDHNKPERINPEEKPEPEFDNQIKLEKAASANYKDRESAVALLTELRCPLCNTYFKEAVITPCCGRSFCGKCIREVLVLTERCPGCSSMEFSVEQLLPNFCLRQTVKHFLESEILATAPEHDLQKYVPDGESGIQGKQISSSVPVTKRYLDLSESQGINQPLNMPQVHKPGQGQDQRFAAGNKNKKVKRTCYMCGSPDHLIRDCPTASARQPRMPTGDPMFQRGTPCYATPYWNGAAFPPVNPYMNMYGIPGMMPFNGNMVPVTPYGAPHYPPSMYGGFPAPRYEQPLAYPEILETRGGENGRKFSDEKRECSSDYEDDIFYKRHRFDGLQRSVEHKSHREKGKIQSSSEEIHGQKLSKEHRPNKRQEVLSVDRKHGKHSHSTQAGRDRRSYHVDYSISGADNMQNSNDISDEARHEKHSRSSTRHHEKWEERGVKRDIETRSPLMRSSIETEGRWPKVSDEDRIEGNHHKRKKRAH